MAVKHWPQTDRKAAISGAHSSENLAYVDACLECYPNFYVDTSARIAEIGRHPVEEAREFFLKNQDRVLFGTDLVLLEVGQSDILNLGRFYDEHWRCFETGERQMRHPLPIQGRWKVNAIGLPLEVLEKLYVGNAKRLIPEL
jgi:predicted TIM-barrel fold metal-dependent hydrolase